MKLSGNDIDIKNSSQEFGKDAQVENVEAEVIEYTAEKKGKVNQVLLGMAVILAAVSVGLMVFNFVTWVGEPRPSKDDKVETVTNASLTAELTTSGFDYQPATVATSMSKWLAEVDIDLSSDDVTITQLDVTKSDIVINYLRADGTINDTIVIQSNPIELGSMSADEIAGVIKSGSQLEKSSTENGIDTCEVAIGIKGLGYIYVAEQIIIDDTTEGFEGEQPDINMAETIAKSIRDTIRFSDGNSSDIYLTLGDFGKLNINELSEIAGASGLLYSTSQNMIDLYNMDSKEVKVFITRMNNQYLGNVPDKLIATEYPNVYLDCGFRNNADFGYGGFAVMTNVGMIYFKISESVENPEQFKEEIINWLGVSTDDEKIDIPYEITLTMDDLMPANESE